MSPEPLTKTAIWLLAIRPKTLPAAVGPVAVGSAMAFRDGGFALFPALACLLGSVLLQIAVNLANDYFDGKNQIDTAERLGPLRVTQSGLLAPREVKGGMIFSLCLVAPVFLYLAMVGGLPIVVIAAASVLAALAYSGGPYPLASNALGELFVFIFFGLVAVGGSYYVQAGGLTWLVLATALPPGLLITAILVVNNLRDIDGDARAGKKTLAVVLGRRGTIVEYRVLLLAAYLVPPLLFSLFGGVTLLLPLLTSPFAWSLAARIGREQGRALNGLLAATAALSLAFSLLFALGLLRVTTG
jgi:1,4-dihydroxy-2-naphthoate polyprenyltransferase